MKLTDDEKAAPEAKQEPVAWMEMVVANLVREGVNKHKARELAQHFATHPAPVNQALLESVAEVAHCGGLVGMSEADALILIRKLTLHHWRKERTREQARAAIAQAEEMK